MKTQPSVVTRFAPSPTGLLHLGHAYAAILAHDWAHERGGRFILRIEDIDTTRCRAEFEEKIYHDLAWLGLKWDEPVRRQSEHVALYRSKLDALSDRGLLYPCFCTRQEIAHEIARMPSAPHGPEGPIYPGTCLALTPDERASRIDQGLSHAWRLNVAQALNAAGISSDILFTETGHGPKGEQGKIRIDPYLFGDVVLGRKDLGVSYHLAVTVDDHVQGITHVTRGEDLFHATYVQRLLQELLGLDEPAYHHHGLIMHESGRRLAKRDKDQTIEALRAAGATPMDIRDKLGLTNRAGR